MGVLNDGLGVSRARGVRSFIHSLLYQSIVSRGKIGMIKCSVAPLPSVSGLCTSVEQKVFTLIPGRFVDSGGF